MTAVPEWEILTDADLVSAAARGDRDAFAGIYVRYADRLHDFCVGMLGDRDAAADCVQDAFCTAATTLVQIRDPTKLRPWLYAIARNEALRRLRQRRREQVADVLPEAASDDAGPDAVALRTELCDLLREAAGGLSDRDRSVLELAYRHGLDGPELGAALDVSPAHARKLAQRLRETIERALGALLVARRARSTPDACPELRAILHGWDGEFNILMRKRTSRHIDSCPTCQQDRSELANPVALLGAVPVFIPAPVWLRDTTLEHIHWAAGSPGAYGGAQPSGQPSEAAAAVSQRATSAATPHRAPNMRRRKQGRLALIGLFALLIVGALLAISAHVLRDTPVGSTNPMPTPQQPVTTAPSTVSPASAPVTITTVPTVVAPPPPTWSPTPIVVTTSAFGQPAPTSVSQASSSSSQTKPPTTFFTPPPRVTSAPPTNGTHKKPLP